MISNKKLYKYVLLTSARNEQNYIKETLDSVVEQIVKPQKWIIISDGSTDMTEEIVSKYVNQHSFIQLVSFKRKVNSIRRNFGSKVDAINHGYQYLNNIEYDFIGQLDADITLGNDFYESLLHEISADTRLGVVGGQVYERIAECFEPVIEHQFNVHGTNQLFRRTCFEDIGGYQPIQTGGEDTVAVITARMMGWKTRTYSNLKVYHHRRMGTANASILRARLKEGVRDYMIGYHYLFHTLKCLKRVSEKPFLLGSIFRFIGFIIGQLCFTNKRSVSKEFVEFLQSEQMKRIYMS